MLINCRNSIKICSQAIIQRYVSTTAKVCTNQMKTKSNMNIFDRRAKRLQKERAALRFDWFFLLFFCDEFYFINIFSPDVELFDYLKEEVGWRVADRIFDLKKEVKVAADIGKKIFSIWQKQKIAKSNKYLKTILGCNRGFVSRHVLAESVEHLYLCDDSPTMLQQAEGTPELKITKLEMDEEKPTVSHKLISSIDHHFW